MNGFDFTSSQFLMRRARNFFRESPTAKMDGLKWMDYAGTGVWKRAVDDYILELGRLMGHKGRRFDVADLVRQYLEEHVRAPTEENTQLIATPERFEAHFLERAQKFDGKFDSKKFRRTMTEAIAKVLRPLAEKHQHLIKPVRRQLGKILDSLAGRRTINSP